MVQSRKFWGIMVLGVCLGCSGSSAEDPTGSSSSGLASCNPATENCCPSTGFSEVVLTENPDTFFSATSNRCVRALGGNDTVTVGPKGYLIGGPGDDTINAWGGGTVIPGPGIDTVSISSAGTVKIFDLCEAPRGETLFGGGDGTLVTPVSLSNLQSRGVSVSGFSK